MFDDFGAFRSGTGVTWQTAFMFSRAGAKSPRSANGTCENSLYGHFGLVGVLATAQFCTVNKYVSFWISARHQVRDLGAVQSSHRLIKRLFEACSSLQLVKSFSLLMSCTQYNRTV